MRTLLFIFLLGGISAYAQQVSIGAFTQASFQFSTLLKSEHKDYDSLNAILNNDKTLNFGIEIGLHKDRFNTIYIKPGFYQSGFLMIRKDLRLFDLVHPAIGEIKDQSQAATKIAYLHHRLRYIGIEASYDRDISPKLQNLPVKIKFGTGLAVNYLLRHEIKMRTEGFAMYGDFKHTLRDSLFFQARDLAFAAFVAFEISYEPEPDLMVYAQTRIKSNLRTVTSNEPRVFIWSPELQVGLRKFL